MRAFLQLSTVARIVPGLSFTPLLVLIALTASGQTPASPPAASAKADPNESPIELSPFHVSTDKDLGYAASSAMSATRTNEKLENLPNAISVLNQDFLQDIAANNFFDAVDFAIGAENIVNDSGTRGAPLGSRSGNQISFRGLPSFRQLRDGFPWYVPQDAYNTERIEVSRGPGGLAYGDVDTGGIVNVTTKRALLRDAYSAQVRYDTFGTQRYSVDLNKELAPKQLALRVNAIELEDEKWRQRSGIEGNGLAAALRWDPLKDRRTSIEATYERGHQKTTFSHVVLNDQRAAYVRGTGTNALDASATLAGVQTNGVGMSRIAAPGNLHAFVLLDNALLNLQSTATTAFRSSAVLVGANVATGADPQNPARFPLVDISESIVPRGQDWAGPDSRSIGDWHAYVVEVQHTFTDRFRVLIAHNGQRDDMSRQTTMNGNILGQNARAILIDVNPALPDAPGTGTVPNPRFEQYFIGYVPIQNIDGHDISSWRGTAVYDAALPWGITQRLVFGLNYRHEKYFRDTYSFALTQEEIARRGFTTGPARFYTNNLVTPIHYLAAGNSDSALAFSPTSGVTGFFRSGVEQRFDQSLTSGSFTALGSYWKGRLRTSVGISRDHWDQKAARPVALDPVTNEARFVDAGGAFVPPDGVPLYPFTRNWVTNQVYGGVFRVTPWLALTGTYQETALFTDNFGSDLFGRPLKPRTGTGVDYGVRFNLLQDRLNASVTFYDNTAENDTANFTAAVNTEVQGLLGPTATVALVDTRDQETHGFEFELVANVTRNWTARLAVSRSQVKPTRNFPQLRELFVRARAAASTRGLDPDTATVVTSDFIEQADADAGDPGRVLGNVVTRYTFTQGALKGLALGGSVRYVAGKPRPSAIVGGLEVLPATTTKDQWVFSPFASYRRKLGRLTWIAQINLNNIFDQVTDQGTVYRYPRYTDPRQIIYTLTTQF